MRSLVLVVGLLHALLPASTASSVSSPPSPSPSSRVLLPANFRPPPVFKNANLVHVIALDRNYGRETINVLVENVSDEPQDQYFIPFTPDQMERLGGLEVRDRKDGEAGPFLAVPAETDPYDDVQYYRISLPRPLPPGGQQTLGITYHYLRAYVPLPAAIAQDEQQFLAYDFSAYCPSAYVTVKQKTEIRCGSGTIPDYTTIPAAEAGDEEQPQRQGSKLVYGPFGEMPAGATLPARVRFEFTKPVIHVALLERDVEVSHWGGNVAFEERYDLRHRGANLSSLFDRAKWAQAKYYKPITYALMELRFQLGAGSVDAYYTDAIGNVSTSRFRVGRRESSLEIRPRYPVFGGWRYPFTIGWNSDAANYVRRGPDAGSFLLSVPFLEGPRQTEGVEYGQVRLRLILPEGAENVRIHTTLPDASVTAISLDRHMTFLDTIGRTVVTITAHNLVDDFRDRDVIVAYDYSATALLRKPVIVFASALAAYLAWSLVRRVEVKFAGAK